ncbi:MAG: zinc ribbon domain-containing protein [Ruminococcus sp.]|nr:zinc ribbon domain-containing protein [Ruminococcus sp.]
MAFCKNCGNQISDDAMFCDKCGTSVNDNGASAQQNEQQYGGPQQYSGAQQYSDPQQNGYAQQPIQPEILSDDADVQKNKGIAWLSYLSLLFLIPLFAAKHSEYTRFHVRQGATLCAASLAYAIVQAVLMAILNSIFRPELTWFGYRQHPFVSLVGVILGLASIFFLVLAIIGIVNAATGKRAELPVIGKFDLIAKLIDKIYDAIC